MAKIIDSLSVFFPAYNEEANIEETVRKAVAVLNKITPKWEIIIVNDGSKDKTLEKSRLLAKEFRGIKVINHKVNRGYGAAFKSGLYEARYPWIAFTDSDGQFDFREITNFIKKQQETKSDMVIGYYLKRQVPLSVKITSKIWESIVYILFGLKVKDIDCGFKLISKEIPDKIEKLEAERGAFITSEFLVKAKRKGFKIADVGVKHYPRKAGKPTGRNLNVIIKSFADLFNLWKRTSLN